MAGTDDNDSTSSDDWLLWIDAIAFVVRSLRKEAAAEDFIIQELSEGRISYPFGYQAEFECEVSSGSIPLRFSVMHHFFWCWPHSKDLDLKIDRDRSSAVRHGSIVEVTDFDDEFKPRSFLFDPRRSMTLRAKWIRLRRSALVRCLHEAGLLRPPAVPKAMPSGPQAPAAPVQSSSGPEQASTTRSTLTGWLPAAMECRKRQPGWTNMDYARDLRTFGHPPKAWGDDYVADEIAKIEKENAEKAQKKRRKGLGTS